MDAKEKSFDLVQETTKLLITLATTFVAFTVTFAKELDGFELSTWWDGLTWSLAWIAMVISIAGGIATLLGLTTVLEPKAIPANFNPSIRCKKVQFWFAVQIVVFGLGVLFTVLFGLGKVLQT